MMKKLSNYQEFILEASKYKDINDERFVKIFNRIVKFHGETDMRYIESFRTKLYEFLSSDEHKKFKINFFDKDRKNKKLIYVIHELDNYLSKIHRMRNKNAIVNVDFNNLKPVWTSDGVQNWEHGKVSVYRANSVFESIELGKNTRFCISSSLDGKHNYFYDYMYNYFEEYEQVSTIYFIIAPNADYPYRTIAIDSRRDCSFLYTDEDNKDVLFGNYEYMINGMYYSNGEIEYFEEPDSYKEVPQYLSLIPESVFEFVIHEPTQEEIDYEPRLLMAMEGPVVNEYANDPSLSLEQNVLYFVFSQFYPDAIDSTNILSIIFNKIKDNPIDVRYVKDKIKDIHEKFMINTVYKQEHDMQKTFDKYLKSKNNNIIYITVLAYDANRYYWDEDEHYIRLYDEIISHIRDLSDNFEYVLPLLIFYVVDSDLNYKVRENISISLEDIEPYNKSIIESVFSKYINGVKSYDYLCSDIDDGSQTVQYRRNIVDAHIRPLLQEYNLIKK